MGRAPADYRSGKPAVTPSGGLLSERRAQAYSTRENLATIEPIGAMALERAIEAFKDWKAEGGHELSGKGHRG